MRYHACKHCGASCEIDFNTCGSCALFTSAAWVLTPEGPGQVVQPRHSGGIIVDVQNVGTRQFRGDQLALIAAPPAAAPPAAAHGAMIAEISRDHTTDCGPLPADPDPLAAIRLAVLSRPFPSWALSPQPR